MSTEIQHIAATLNPESWTLVERVAWQARIHPEATAVASRDLCLTYAQLEKRADELSVALTGLGVGPESVVGLFAGRSPSMIVGALGILKAGGAYLPLDPAYPQARLNYQLEDAGSAVVVANESCAGALASDRRQRIVLDGNGQMVEAPRATRGLPKTCVVTGDTLAYVIYTSGSTGQPKGVEITHSSLLNLIEWHRGVFKVTAEDRASQLARVGFDASVWEIWPYLSSGASLHQPEAPLISEPEPLQGWLLEHGITIAFVPSPMAERLLALPWPAKTSLRAMLTGGDVLHSYAPKDLPFLLVNNYGTTECTVVSTSALVPTQGPAGEAPPIGLPIQKTQLYVLDELGNPLPPGQWGELYIGGAGLARGYRHQPALTEQRFLRNPFSKSPGDRLFKTGDRVRCLPDGQFVFAGRLDDQLKIRGYRIEPDEIATALNQHPAILQSVVAARETSLGDRQLVGYFVPRAQSRPKLTELQQFLAARLPEFMVPGLFVVLESLPLTSNGKVDRRALPVPDNANSLRDVESTAPKTAVEITVAGILAELLGVDRLNLDDNFFALGGHSLLGTQLISRVRQAYGVRLALRDLFETPTVGGISARIEEHLRIQLEATGEEQVQNLPNSKRLPNEPRHSTSRS